MNNYQKLNKNNLSETKDLLKLNTTLPVLKELEYSQIREFLLKYNNYITQSKHQVGEIIRNLEYDIYLIEKLRDVDMIDDVY